MSFIVMIGGAGATVNQQYGLPTFVGIMMGILAARYSNIWLRKDSRCNR